jgi:hypothetical protein
VVPAKISIRDTGRRWITFRGRFDGSGVALDPRNSGGLLRITGGPGGPDTGVLELPPGAWRGGKAKVSYTDAERRAGGIGTAIVRIHEGAGTIRIKGGGRNWVYGLDRPQVQSSVTLEIGTSRWCALFQGEDLLRNRAGHLRARTRRAPVSCSCARTVASTWEAIQTVVFAEHGCRTSFCHGSAPGAANLDLRVGAAYGGLLLTPSVSDPTIMRVSPGSEEKSMLWLKLAAGTLRLQGVPPEPMPFGGLPLTEGELDAVGSWIANGAPETGIVPDTLPLLGACPPDAYP